MSEQFRFSGLNNLAKSLVSTNVLSEDYQREIMGWTLKAIEEATLYERERKDQRVKKLEEALREILEIVGPKPVSIAELPSVVDIRRLCRAALTKSEES